MVPLSVSQTLLFPFDITFSTACFMDSAARNCPFFMFTTLPVSAAALINRWSPVSSEAILYMGASSDSKNLIAERSKGELNGKTLSDLHNSNNSECHSQGVYAS